MVPPEISFKEKVPRQLDGGEEEKELLDALR